jgi:hypothetical protein
MADLSTDSANAEAWRLFNQVYTRLTFDTHCASVVLTKLAGDRDPEAFAELVDRFSVLYDTLYPPPEKKPETN